MQEECLPSFQAWLHDNGETRTCFQGDPPAFGVKDFMDKFRIDDHKLMYHVGRVADWNQGKIPVLLAHPAAAGHGLNLQGYCQHVLWHSMTWDLELYEQFIARVLRQGNRYEHVTVHHIIAKDTIDEVMMRALRGKAKVQSRLLSALKDYRLDKRK